MNTNLNNKIDSISNRKIWVHRLFYDGECAPTLSPNKIRSFYIVPFNIYSTDSEPIDTEEKLVYYLTHIESPANRTHSISVTGYVRAFNEDAPNQNILGIEVTKEHTLSIIAMSENTYDMYLLISSTISDKVMSL